MWVKIHKKDKSRLVTICSEDVLGKVFSSGKQELKVKEPFFGGEKLPLKDLKYFLDHFKNVTLAGNEVVEEAIKLKIVQKENVQIIEGVMWIICLNE
jgi:hypothetical protein